MENVSVLINQLIIMAIYLLVGFLLQKGGKINAKNSSALSALLLYVLLPCVIVKAFIQESTPEKNMELLWSMILGALSLLVAIVISAVLFKKHPITNFAATFSNAGFMGIPLIAAVLGTQAVFYTAGMVAMLNVIQWTYGQSILSGTWDDCKPKAILTSPMLIAWVIGLVLYFTGITLPGQLGATVNAFAACNAPVAMVIVGVFLGQTSLSTIKDPQVWLGCAVRLLLIPLATILVFALFPSQPMAMRTGILIAAIAPVGSNLTIYAAKNNMDVSQGTALVCFSTILSLITMPLMMTAAQMIW